MRVLVFLAQLLFWLVVVRLVLRGLARAFAGPARSRRPPGPGQPRPTEDLVQDAVCRTYIPRSRAVSARIGGREEHFCSTACRDKALAAGRRAS